VPATEAASPHAFASSAALELARRVLAIEADAVRALIDRLDERFLAAVSLILGRRGRVVVSGIGKSGHVARKVASTLASTGTPAYFVHPAEASHGDLGMIQAEDIFIGVNFLDYSGYPDCRPEFIEAFERVANLATQAGVEGRSRFRVHAPLITLTKAQIVARAYELGVDLSLTWSCYEPEADGRACGLCDSCRLRKKGFAEAHLADPVPTAR